ncbi:hypothetical protein H0H81_005668 [Sphagnurus paluster]|uniref:Uncharacterized protein n=1 Tax=Sphagnurus paluster TaxID=117069 RepID=A0A9P7K5H6_9AGAR|nr:hypothetical protein H0H81_005668 [Sphagnurus paluster]
MVAADAPESTAVATPTGPAGAGSTAKSSSSSKAGPIAGGVVGGLVAIGLIAALIFWLTRRNRSKIAPSAEATNTYAAVPPNAQTPMSYNTAAPSFPLPSPKLYVSIAEKCYLRYD